MKKIFKVCVCGLMAAVIISGCSKKAPETTEGETAATESDAQSEAGETTPETMATVDLTGMDNGTVTLGNYKGIEVTKTQPEVTDEEVNQAIENILQAKVTYTEVDRAVQDGDKVNIDYAGTMDGKAFDGGTAQGQDLTIGSNQFIDGFEDGLIGAKKGDKVTLNLTFPSNYGNADLAGKPVVFDVTVNTVNEKKIPELDDAFVQENSDFKTVDEYKEDQKQSLLASKDAQAEQQLKSDIYTAVLNDSTVKPNQDAIDANYSNILASYTNQAAAYGLDLATFASSFTGMTEEDFKTALQSQAEAMVEQRLIVNAIAEKENITISDDDRKNTADLMGYESVDKMIESAGQFSVDDYIMSDKVINFLVENAVIK